MARPTLNELLWLLAAAIYSAFLIFYLPFAQWVATSPIGTSLLLHLEALLLLPAACALPGIPILTVCLFLPNSRRPAALLLLACVIMLPSAIIGGRWGQSVRMDGMRKLPANSAPLINAINAYIIDSGQPPPNLDQLVPKYLSHIPSTGLGAYPEYEYHVGPEASATFDGNPWALTIFTPNLFMNFDQVLYFPLQNYPEYGHGGGIERIGSWAYVHE